MNSILHILLMFILLVSASPELQAQEDRFPRNPNLEETPGKLCSTPSSKRYPEKINYCERNVDTYTKNAIIMKYDKVLGYQVRIMKREDFKIDHLIPLCAGGDNDEDNLWPQHKSVYKITDPLEPVICQKMQEGKLTQAEAVKTIIYAKMNLHEVPSIIKKISKL